VDFDGRTFHFCSEECKEVFQTNPGPYANAVA
jgi:YHS domain-containing protein